MPELAAFRAQRDHQHDWHTVDRDEHGAIQLCPCGAARRLPDEPDDPDQSGKTIPWPRAGKVISLTSGRK